MDDDSRGWYTTDDDVILPIARSASAEDFDRLASFSRHFSMGVKMVDLPTSPTSVVPVQDSLVCPATYHHVAQAASFFPTLSSGD